MIGEIKFAVIKLMASNNNIQKENGAAFGNIEKFNEKFLD